MKDHNDSPSVPTGYKLTEVGVIPEDWGVSQVGRTCTQVTTGKLDANAMVENGAYRFYTCAKNYYLIDSYAFDCEALLISGNGAHVGYVHYYNGKFNAYQRTYVLSGFKSAIKYVQHYLEKNFRNRIQVEVRAGGTPYITRDTITESPIPLPPTEVEQCAIATALSDVDALLDGLDRLIAKKRDLKQAAMQQLLTGETRLPGFDGEWEVKRLGDHVTFLRNGVNSRAELTLDDPVKYLHYGDIHSCTSVMLDPASLPSLPSCKAKTLERLRDGDLVFADASEDLVGVSKSVEISNLGDAELVAGLHTIAARFDKAVLADGFKAYLQFCPAFSCHLRRLAAGTKVYATNRSHIASVEMRLPGIKEQEAIASTFNDMDAEIAALEQRRTKTKDIKQTMMQELLTGRIRLLPTTP